MNEALFALLLALAWFGAVNAVLSAAAAGIGWLIQRGAVGLRASSAPDVLLLLKLVPGVVALFFTFVVFLPATGGSSPRARRSRPATRSWRSGCSARSRWCWPFGAR